MKAILHSVSYAGLWGQDALSLDHFVAHAASLGYAGVMLMSKRPHLSPLDYDDQKLDQLAHLLQEKNLVVACIAAYSDPNGGFSATAPPFAPIGEMQLFNIKRYAEMARQLHAPIIRLMTGMAATGEPYKVQWDRCVAFMREACDIAAPYGIDIGLQNHDDIAGHYQSMVDLIEEINRPNCKACFDAWSVALQGEDPAEAVQALGDKIVHTTVADYVKRPRFRYHHPGEGNVYERILDEVRAVPPGEGFIDYPRFFDALKANGFNGTVAFEMCSPIRGGGAQSNLDTYSKQFLDFIQPWLD